MNILVAGGAGFVGSHLCEKLKSQGHNVTALDSLITGSEKNVRILESKGIRFIKADIVQLPELQERFDRIYNLASPASPYDFDKIPIEIMMTASVGHKNLLDLAHKNHARILFASTSEIYGDPEVHPQQEDYHGNVNTIGPRGCYDEAKRFGEALTMSYFRKLGVATRLARIFNTYGPRMRETDGRIIPNFFTQGLRGESLTVFGDGSQTRSFCYVEDLCDGLMALMESSETRPVNLGNPIELTVLQMAETVKKLTKNTQPIKNLPLPENDPKKRKPDITRAKESLNWEPKISLEDGLQKTLDYFRATTGI